MTVLTRFDLLQYLGWRGFWDADRGSRGHDRSCARTIHAMPAAIRIDRGQPSRSGASDRGGSRQYTQYKLTKIKVTVVSVPPDTVDSVT